ncbi:MAG TPA: hypothetical protein VFU98_01700 [Microlunatus sp.]|nr:hypothetical protein [Microlunatus sp.]
MSTTDDWQWFWAGESGRDSILRDEVEGLHARLSSASASTSRLSSQLANLSGSIETRLNALSKAFDAYVELGDVREALGAYEEPAAVRRDVMAAVEALAGGRPAPSVDARGLDYWLPYATNAVIGYVQGTPTDVDLDRARELAPRADLFVVAACGALGHGTEVAGLVPTVLTGDQVLTEHQRVIWQAVADGWYGELTGDLAAGLAEVWRPLLDREPVAGWSAWVRSHASSPAAGVSWLHTLVTDPASLRVTAGERSARDDELFHGFARSSDAAAEPATPDSRDALRAVVTELIGRGMPAEADLLQRARELRALIEEPSRRPTPAEELDPVTVVTQVRHALLGPLTSPSARATVLCWTAPALSAVLDELTRTAQEAPPVRKTLRGSGGVIDVTPAGPDQTAMAAGLARLDAAYAVPRTPLIGWSVGSAAAALLALGLGIAGSGWAWLFAIALVIGVVGVARQLSARRATHHARADAVERLQREVAEATAEVEATERERSAELVQLTGVTADLRSRLGSPAGGAVSPAGGR